MADKPKPRNTKIIGFSEEEYREIKTAADKAGLYPRQLIMLKIRGDIE